MQTFKVLTGFKISLVSALCVKLSATENRHALNVLMVEVVVYSQVLTAMKWQYAPAPIPRKGFKYT